MGDLLSARLRSQHHDLAQGAMYAPDEDPQWDATLEAADEIEALRARLTAAEERAEQAERERDRAIAGELIRRQVAAEAQVAALTAERDEVRAVEREAHKLTAQRLTQANAAYEHVRDMYIAAAEDRDEAMKGLRLAGDDAVRHADARLRAEAQVAALTEALREVIKIGAEYMGENGYIVAMKNRARAALAAADQTVEGDE